MSGGLRPLRAGTSAPLLERHDLLLLDLDGTVYVAPEVIPTAPAALEQARRAGARLLFLTNNALRTPEQTADLLTGLGVPAAPDEVVTSAQAAAGLLAADLPAGSRILVVGGEGLRRAVADVGLAPVAEAAERPAAVVQGYAPTVDWALLSEGALAVRAGARWMATNLDLTLPSPRGLLVGNGALVAAVRAATGAEPEVAGKPERHLVDAALARVAAPPADGRDSDREGEGLVVGDRLDTDIACANRARLPSLLVLTGVSGVPELLTAVPQERPSWVGRDLTALQQTHPPVQVDEGGEARCGGWRARVVAGRLEVGPSGGAAPGDGGDGLDGLRAAAVAAWAAVDAGTAVDVAEAVSRLDRLDRLDRLTGP
ncbi:MAG: HAD-IIA family hydrolase [Motilibacteraceae bacterium]